MEKEVMEKMARYVELSERFSKSERDIFTDEELRNNNNYSTNSFGTTMGSGTVCVNVSTL